MPKLKDILKFPTNIHGVRVASLEPGQRIQSTDGEYHIIIRAVFRPKDCKLRKKFKAKRGARIDCTRIHVLTQDRTCATEGPGGPVGWTPNIIPFMFVRKTLGVLPWFTQPGDYAVTAE